MEIVDLKRMFKECGVNVRFVDVTTPKNRDAEILSDLAEDGGFTTGQVAKHVTGATRQATLSWLMDLHTRGLVAKLDDQKPICWVRTAAGTKALNPSREPSQLTDGNV